MKARLTLIIFICSILCACAGPSLRYKKDVAHLMDKGDFAAATAKIQQGRSKIYGDKNELLYLLDLSSMQSAAHQYQDSNITLAQAQDKIRELFTKSVSRSLGTLIINDNTQPYRAPNFEQSLVYFFRAMDFLSMDDLDGAGVEARKAVFYLDNLRERKKDGYNDDPFIQYFASMVFEDTGNLSSARISRENAKNAYERFKGWNYSSQPNFPLPPDFAEKGEAVIFHYNGKVPLKISNEIMFAWNNLGFTLESNDDLQGVSQDTINAVFAGAFGRSITVSFPALIDNAYNITSSAVVVEGHPETPTQLVADIKNTAKQNLKEEMAANQARMITRAVTKYILSAQAKNLARSTTDSDTIGDIVGMMFSVFSNLTEKADTRSWSTLPAEIRMASIFLYPGVYDLKLKLYDMHNHTIDEHVFEKVQINKGHRTYLYHRTAK